MPRERTFAFLKELLKEDVKALQNLDASIKAFAHLLELYVKIETTTDVAQKLRLTELASDSFYAAVIRYCKPFTVAIRGGSRTQYALRRVIENLLPKNHFSRELHDHLLELRNKLIGHDDHDVIEPKVMTSIISPQDENGQPNGYIPVAIEATNKCIGYPLNEGNARQFQLHAGSVLAAIYEVFKKTADEARQRALAFPNEANETATFSQQMGSFRTTLEGNDIFHHPNLTSVPWFNLSDPFEGYNYINCNVRIEFNDQTVTLPNGDVFEMRSNTSEH